ncbi:MAG: AMP-binding protein [candidate division KSB1 bacterium]|nr:AMP-binding protein [candidate division KSB1 bacterium]
MGENSPNWVIAYCAVEYIGAVAVPILTGFPESDIRHIIRHSESVAAFVAEKHMDSVEEIDKSSLHTIYTLEDFTEKKLKQNTAKELEKHIQSFLKQKGRKPKDEDLLEHYKPEEDELAAIIYTSGTTGHSKGVMLTHKNIASDVVNSIKQFPIDHQDRFLSILPLSHTFECTGGMMCPLSAGSSIAYMSGLPTPQKLLSAMATVQPTAVLTVPLVMDKIYRKRILPQIQEKAVIGTLYKLPFFRKKLNKVAGKKLHETFGGKLRFFMFGGAALNVDVETFLRDAGISYSTGYGMTETSPILTINPFGKVKVGSCGQTIPGIEIKIHEPNPETGVGEIIINGPIVMQGYYKNEKETERTFLDKEWLRTGDLGYFDPEGYLFIKGRSKNVIVGPSGENIYPEIIEQELMQSPFIQEVVVYQSKGRLLALAYPDYDMIDQEIDGKKESEETESRIEDILDEERKKTNERLPHFAAVSKIFEQREPFEKTPTNKVKRYLYIPKNDVE